MKLVIGRIASIAITVGGWVLVGGRVALDLIGYSTVPEDLAAAQTLLQQSIGYLLSVPWQAFFGFALVSTMWLMWVSWPRQQVAPDAPKPVSEAEIQAPSMGDDLRLLANTLHPVIGSIEGFLRVITSRHSTRSQRDSYLDYGLEAEIESLFLRFADYEIPVPYFPEAAPRQWRMETIERYFKRLGPLLRDGHLDAARDAAKIITTEVSDS